MRITKINSLTVPNVGEDMEKLGLSHTVNFPV